MTPASPPPRLLVFGAHPDDIEFGCGAVIAREHAAGRPAHFVIATRGEAATNGSPAERTAEAEAGANRLGATCEFLPLGGDCQLCADTATIHTLARTIRRLRPALVLAPTTTPGQHPDHVALGTAVRQAARLARYGGVAELRDAPAHAIDALYTYAITAEAEAATPPLLIDVSDPAVFTTWNAAMEAHQSQSRTRNYAELQRTRARVFGLRAGVEHAWPLWPDEPLLFPRLPEAVAARRF